jgi:hypothetical protein
MNPPPKKRLLAVSKAGPTVKNSRSQGVASKSPTPPPAPTAAVSKKPLARDKVIAALKRLHPMD